jgi:hypothetical protein
LTANACRKTLFAQLMDFLPWSMPDGRWFGRAPEVVFGQAVRDYAFRRSEIIAPSLYRKVS